MKKLFNILLAVCCLGSFVACDDDVENPYATESSISIVAAHLDFSPASSVGSIHFASNSGTVTATTRASWCTATVSADSVIVSVDQNTGVAGRSTVVVLRNGSDSIQVPVTQRGIILSVDKSEISSGNAAGSDVVVFTSNMDVQVLSAPDWITTSLSGDTLEVSFTANTTGHIRRGYVAYQSGGVKDSLRVQQADFDTDIAGTYTFYYSDDAEGPQRNFSVTVSRDALRITSLGLSIPMTYDSDAMSFTIQSGCYVGRYSSYYVYAAFQAGNYWTAYNTMSTLTLSFDYDDVEGTSGTFSGYLGTTAGALPIDGIILEAFSSNSMTESADQGPLMTFYRPTLKRAPVVASSYVLR